LIRTASGVGTILFDVAVHPTTGELWVANTDARNVVRFEPNLRGHLVQTRITRVNPSAGAVLGVNDLTPNITYSVRPGPAAESADSLSQPGDGVFTSNGSTFYVTAFGSSKVGVVNASGVVTGRIPVGGGPSGVALNEAAGRLYVLNRFEDTISAVDTASQTEIGVTGVAGPAAFDPSPDVIKIGRKFLYEAPITSGHGDIACATCHVFGNFDNIAWDLGDPTGDFLPFSQAPWVHFAPLAASTNGFDPMKGPMTTQTLRGLKDLEPFHWRGDRQNFNAFNRAFVAFMGMSGHCSVSQGQSCNSTADCPAGEFCFGSPRPELAAHRCLINDVNSPPHPFPTLRDAPAAPIRGAGPAGGGTAGPRHPKNGTNLLHPRNPAARRQRVPVRDLP